MDYKCPIGTTKQCISDTQEFTTCDKLTSYPTCIDKDSYYVTIKKDQPYVTCNNNQNAFCIDKGTSWTTCDLGSQATCLDKTKYAVWTGSNAYSCNAGQTAMCQN